MSRVGVAVLLVVCLVFCAANYGEAVACCYDHHKWGNGNSIDHCSGAKDNDTCNTWCMSSCRGGECKIRGGQVCHCYC